MVLDAEKLRAAAVLRQVSRPRYVAFVALAMLVQVLWGLYGVCTRYLQTSSAQSVPTLQLTVVLTVVAWAGLVLFVTIPNVARALFLAARRHHWCGRAARNRWPQQGRAACAAPQPAATEAHAAAAVAATVPHKPALQPQKPALQRQPSLSPLVGDSKGLQHSLTAGKACAHVRASFDCPPDDDPMLAALMLRSSSSITGPLTHPSLLAAAAASRAAAAAAEAQRASAGARRRAQLLSFAAATVIGSLVALQTLTLIYASRFMEAYLVQLVFMFTPLLTAIASRCLLKQPTPVGLWRTLAFAVVGSAMVIVGEWLGDRARAAANDGVSAYNARDMLVGLALAIVSMLLLAAYLVLLQVTQHLVTGVQVMWANTYVTIVLLTPIALGVEGVDWSWVFALRPFDWGVLVFAGFFIDACNTIWTQNCSRVLGAAVVSLFISLRLVSSVAGSILLLHDIPSHGLAWAGFALVIAAMTFFFYLQFRANRKAKAAAAAEAAAAEEASAVAAEEGVVGADSGIVKAQTAFVNAVGDVPAPDAQVPAAPEADVESQASASRASTAAAAHSHSSRTTAEPGQPCG